MPKLTCTPENAPKILEWLREGRGVALWRSANLSNPGGSWMTPAKDKDGSPGLCPSWQAQRAPEAVYDDIGDVVVNIPRLVMRFHVGVKCHGMSLKVTEAGTRRIHEALEKAGEGSWLEFDYDVQDALIYAVERTLPLADWAKENGL